MQQCDPEIVRGLAHGISPACREVALSIYIYKKTSTQTYNPYHIPTLCFASHTKLKPLNMSVYVITGLSKGIGVSLPYAVFRIAFA